MYSVLYSPDGPFGPFYKSKMHFEIFNNVYLAFVWNALLPLFPSAVLVSMGTPSPHPLGTP